MSACGVWSVFGLVVSTDFFLFYFLFVGCACAIIVGGCVVVVIIGYYLFICVYPLILAIHTIIKLLLITLLWGVLLLLYSYVTVAIYLFQV